MNHRSTMNQICHSYRIEIEVLTPVHVGSGEPNLAYDLDFAVDRGQVWVIDQAKMLSRLSDEQLEASIDAKITHILRPAQFRDFSRYSLVVPSGPLPQEIYPCVKDLRDRPYLPGSTLKGALRTALAWEHSTESRLLESVSQPAPPGQRSSPKFAARQLEQSLFGPDPNHDLLRALSVSDCTGADVRPILSAVSLLTLRGDSLAPKGQGFRFYVETLPPGAALVGTLRMDDYLFTPQAARAALRDKRSWIDEFDRACRSLATSLLRREIEFHSRARHSRAQQECERLRQVNRSLGEGQFLLQIGWGTGWASKTIGTRLPEASLSALVRRFNLDRGRRHPVFPKTRRLVEVQGSPSTPLGWVKVTLKGDSR